MLCDRVLGRWPGDPDGADLVQDPRLDLLDLDWDECHRRALAKSTRRGRPVRLLLRLGTTLRHGDVVADAADCLLVVRVEPAEVLVARPASAREAAAVALEWGNLHVPVQILDDGSLVTLADGPALGLAAKHGVTVTTEQRRFEPVPISGLTWTLGGSGLVVATAPTSQRV
ncbi:MAG TPA: hypothetical protein VF796_13690 [Humisphaera sp.]